MAIQLSQPIDTQLDSAKKLVDNLAALANATVAISRHQTSPTGLVGEFISSDCTASPVALGTGVAANITSILVPSGDWDISGAVWFISAVGTLVTNFGSAINNTSATLPGSAQKETFLSLAFTANNSNIIPTPVVRFSLSAPTTIYLVGFSVFTVSTLTATGYLRATRAKQQQ